MTELALQQAIHSAVQGIFGGRLYPVAAAENPTYPYGVVAVEGSTPENTLCGRSDLTNYRFRFDVYAKTYAEVVALSPQVMAAMDAFGIPIFELDVYEPEIRAMRRIMDFSVWRKE